MHRTRRRRETAKSLLVMDETHTHEPRTIALGQHAACHYPERTP
ncbi:hypothetical protein [Kitasatospora camelliae]|uniref:Uncharacterized protein n=1 Tax=Kitasatospora camelliae TaxID=3156397 RepID=A0AAU8JQY5_9ACTN